MAAKPSPNPSETNAKEMGWASRFSKDNDKESISDMSAISKISVKTGLSPNLLKAIYPSQNGSKKCDLSKMSQDLNEKGKEVIMQRAKDFTESKESFANKYYPGGIEMNKEAENQGMAR